MTSARTRQRRGRGPEARGMGSFAPRPRPRLPVSPLAGFPKEEPPVGGLNTRDRVFSPNVALETRNVSPVAWLRECMGVCPRCPSRSPASPYQVWPIYDMLLYAYVPTAHRPLFNSFMSIAWGGYLSHVSQPHEGDHEDGDDDAAAGDGDVDGGEQAEDQEEDAPVMVEEPE